MSDNLPCGCPKDGKRSMACEAKSHAKAPVLSLRCHVIFTANALKNLANDFPDRSRIQNTLLGHSEDLRTAAQTDLALQTEMLAALKGVVAVADRKTVEFDRARDVIRRAEG